MSYNKQFSTLQSIQPSFWGLISARGVVLFLDCSTLKMEAICPSKTSITVYQFTQQTPSWLKSSNNKNLWKPLQICLQYMACVKNTNISSLHEVLLSHMWGPMMPTDMIKQGVITSISIWTIWTAELRLYSTFQVHVTVKVWLSFVRISTLMTRIFPSHRTDFFRHITFQNWIILCTVYECWNWFI